MREDKVAHYNLGVVYYRQGFFELAEHEFRRALELDSSYAQAHYSLGLLMVDIGELDEALVSLTAVTKLEPDNFHAVFDTGIVLGRLGRWDEAEEYFRRAHSINPKFEPARMNVEFFS